MLNRLPLLCRVAGLILVASSVVVPTSLAQAPHPLTAPTGSASTRSSTR